MATQEIARRSRQKDHVNNILVRVSISDADDYAPVVGSAFTGDSGITSRLLRNWSVRDSDVRGYWIVSETFVGYNAR